MKEIVEGAGEVTPGRRPEGRGETGEGRPGRGEIFRILNS